MVLCDSNWLALALSQHVHHQAARASLEAVEKLVSVCFCRATQRSFLRLLTNACGFAQDLEGRHLASFALQGDTAW